MLQVERPFLVPPSSSDDLLKRAHGLPRAEADLTPEAFFENRGPGRKIVSMQEKQVLFAQGDAATAVFYIQKGKIKLTVTSKSGKEATIALLDAGEFVGEECLITVQPQRTSTAVVFTPCTLLRIEREEMLRALREEETVHDLFVAFVLARNLRIQEDLIDQLLNFSEKRLARTLLLLARFGKHGVIPKISQQELAEMVGTTRARVSCFMNRFRELGYVEYSRGPDAVLRVHDSLRNIVLEDWPLQKAG